MQLPLHTMPKVIASGNGHVSVLPCVAWWASQRSIPEPAQTLAPTLAHDPFGDLCGPVIQIVFCFILAAVFILASAPALAAIH